MDFAAESAFDPSSPVPSRALTPKPTDHSVGPSGAQAPSSSSSSSLAPADQSSSSAQSVSSTDGESSQEPEGTASLEQEVGQVVQQLSSWGGNFWGGLRKQSAFAFDSVKKDFSRTVQEAQEDLKKLQTQTVEVGLKDISASQSDTTASTNSKGKGRETVDNQIEDETATDGSAVLPGVHVPTTQDAKHFFAKIGETLSSQSGNINASINQNLAAVQKSLSESIASASANPQLQSLNLNKLTRNDINFAQFTDNIQKNLAQAGTLLNIQQAEKIAEDYLRKSEGLLHNAGEFLKDAVKVVPPEDGDVHGVVWDGSDSYAFTTAGDRNESGYGNSYDGPRSTSFEVSRSQLRKEALLRRLRGDKELFLVDPGAATESAPRRSAFEDFCKSEIEHKGGIESAAFQAMIQAELGQGDKEADTLKSTMDDLVPSQLSKNVFWTRYFFHKHSIEDEEAKRQRILQQATLQPQAEDFSWDEEDESPTTAETMETVQGGEPSDSESAKASATLANAVHAQQNLGLKSSDVTDSSNTSTRVSEESYVAVNTQKSKPSSGGAAVRSSKPLDATTKSEDPANADGDDDDSDWE